MSANATHESIRFLKGGGEMGELIRTKDWSNTSLGQPANWPQSLRTTLSIIINSKFPMLLWWGADLTCFYNDAYRPSLGRDGKHPSVLGKKAADAWPEIWDIIKPLIDQVLTGGESTWSEDQLMPIYRNSQIEDIYWTCCYSPVTDESGNVAGVLVTCSEATQKVTALKILEANNRRYLNDIMQAPIAMCIFRGKDYTVEVANALMLELWGKPLAEVINKPIFEGLPESKGQGLEQLLDNVYKTGEKFVANEHPVNLPRNGKIEVFFINFVYEALKEPDGTISGVVAIASDVTEQVQVRLKTADSEKRFRNIVKQAPLGITIFRGPDFIVEMANETYLQLVDKKETDFVGRPLFKSLPEVEEIVAPLLTRVLTTGIAFHATDFPVSLNRYGKIESTWFNLVYHALREENNDISGIIVVATEVTASVKARLFLSESEKQFRNLVMQSPIPMAILRGEDYIVETANLVMFEKIWRKKESDIIGKKILEVFPELREQKYADLLNKVYASGEVCREFESVAYVQGDDGLKKFYLDFEYRPLYETNAKISGVIVTVNDVTVKVSARKKAEDAEERLRLATEAAELSTWDLDLLTREIIHTPRLAEIFGHDQSKKISHPQMRSQIHPADRQEIVEKAFERAMETGIYTYEARVVKPDNTVCWIRVQGKVFYDDASKPVKLIGMLRDITEEKYHEQELLESEQKFRLLADSMPQQVWTADPSGNLNYFNQSVFNYSGLTPDEINVKGWLHIVHPDDRPENVRMWVNAITTGADFLFVHRFRRFDGEYRWQLSRAIPQKDAAGNIQMWVGTSTDIEDQKMFSSQLEKQIIERTKELMQLNETLIRSEERYHLMVEEVQDYAILYLNRDGIVENWNKGAEKIKGYKAEEIIGKNFSVFYPELERNNHLPETLLNEALTKGKVSHEGWRLRKDGSRFWASVVITAVHDTQANVIGFSKLTHDLTDKKKADDKLKLNAEQLEQKNNDLEKMNEELQSFAYVSSHDLQEPLRKIQTFATRITEKEAHNLSEKGKDYFRRMQEAAKRMQTLIEDLLAYSRTNTAERNFENTDLNKIVEEVKKELKEDIKQKHATIETGELCEANVIPFQFRQLVHNLIGNALKFSKPGNPPYIKINSEIVEGIKLAIAELPRQKNYCHLSISDNGIGFDQQYEDRIFEVFQRLHGNDEYKGTGIGLAIVKKIVENHQGIITATGELNKGATFDIYLPAT